MFVDAESITMGPSNPEMIPPGPSRTSFDPIEDLSLPALEREIGELAADINAATCRWLLLAAEFDRRGGHEAYGFVSCATWLAWRCSLTARAAREQLRVGRKLATLPIIREKFGTGRLSYSKVRALTRVAEPEVEEHLLELAEEATAAQLERILRGYRRATTEDEVAARERRFFSTRWEADGTLSVRGSLPAEEGALLRKALELVRESLREGDEAMEGEGLAPQPDNADALVALAESGIAGGVTAASGGDRHQVVLHVDLEAGRTAGLASATIDDGVSVAPDVALRLGCDASLVTLVERGGEAISVGRKTRSVPPSMHRALRSRDRGCRFPGCDRDRFVDAHHVKHWAAGGDTSLENLVQLCRHHHRLVHEGGFSVERASGGFVFRHPSGRVIEEAPPVPAGSVSGCIRAGRATGRRREGASPAPRSAGEPMDLDLTVWTLAHLRKRRVPAAAAKQDAASLRE